MRNILGYICLGLICLFALAWGSNLHFNSSPNQVDYSFSTYRISHHIPVSLCSLPTVQAGGKEQIGIVLCLETGKKPTRAQINAWMGYVLWDSCYEYGSKYACDQLGN